MWRGMFPGTSRPSSDTSNQTPIIAPSASSIPDVPPTANRLRVVISMSAADPVDRAMISATNALETSPRTAR